MKELRARDVTINDPFWSARLAVNARKAIFHQWKQLEATHCIDNFRIAAGEKDGFREGWYFADSDAYKWLDAASRILALHADPELASIMNDLISLLARAQRTMVTSLPITRSIFLIGAGSTCKSNMSFTASGILSKLAFLIMKQQIAMTCSIFA